MKTAVPWIALGMMLTASSILAGGADAREKTDKAGVVKPAYERSGLENPTREKPLIERQNTGQVFHRQDGTKIREGFPPKPIAPAPHLDRRIVNGGENSTQYRIGPQKHHYYRSVLHRRYYHRNLKKPKAEREIGY